MRSGTDATSASPYNRTQERRRRPPGHKGGTMDTRDPAPHAITCHRCGKPMDFHTQEAVGDKRVRIFHCAGCDTLEAVEDGRAA